MVVIPDLQVIQSFETITQKFRKSFFFLILIRNLFNFQQISIFKRWLSTTEDLYVNCPCSVCVLEERCYHLTFNFILRIVGAI